MCHYWVLQLYYFVQNRLKGIANAVYFGTHAGTSLERDGYDTSLSIESLISRTSSDIEMSCQTVSYSPCSELLCHQLKPETLGTLKQ